MSLALTITRIPRERVLALTLAAAAALAGAGIVAIGLRFSPKIALAGAGGLMVVLLTLRYPLFALYLTAALVPIERFGRFTDDSTQFTISLMRIVGLVALGALVLHRLVRRGNFAMGPEFLLYGGYTVMAVVSVVYTTDFLGTVRAASAILGNLLFLFVVVNMTSDRRVIINCVAIWLVMSTAIALYSVYDWHFGSGVSGVAEIGDDVDRGRGVQSAENRWSTVWADQAEFEELGDKSLRRTMGSTSHAAVYGINCILTVPFILFFMRFAKHPITRAALIGVLGLMLYNILLTNTRAAILLVAGVLALCALFGLVKLRPAHIAIALAAGGIGAALVPQDVYNRILDLSNYSIENSASLRIRMEYFQAGLRAVADHSLIGSGVANENIVPEYLQAWSSAPERTTVHNEYLQTLMELGLAGFMLLFGFVGLLFLYAIRAARRFRPIPDCEHEYWFMVAVQIAMLSVLVYGLQVDVFHFPLKGWWLLAGFTIVLYGWSRSDVSPDRGMEPAVESRVRA